MGLWRNYHHRYGGGTIPPYHQTDLHLSSFFRMKASLPSSNVIVYDRFRLYLWYRVIRQ